MAWKLAVLMILCVGAWQPAWASELPAAGAVQKPDGGPAAQKEKKSKPRGSTKLSGKIYSLFTADDRGDKPAGAFELGKARVKLDWLYGRMLSGAVQMELAGIAGGDEDIPLRDAYVRLAPVKWLRFTMGQFKKPFSRAELRAYSKLEFIQRGIGNAFMSRDLGFGGRDVGISVGGRLPAVLGLRYDLGVFNGDGPNAEESDPKGGKDFAGRVELNPWKALSVGANVSVKTYNTVKKPDKPVQTWMAGADVVVDPGLVRLDGELLWGENHSIVRRPMAWSALGAVSRSLRLGTVDGMKLRVEPMFRFEYIKPDSELAGTAVLAYTPGVNVKLGDFLRLMADLEFRRAEGSVIPDHESATCFLLQLALDMK